MKDNKQIMCDECKKLVPISEVRYNVKGDLNLRLCSNCRDRNTPKKNKQPLSDKKVEVKEDIKDINDSILDKNEYFCTRCRYKFRFDPYKVSKLKCPYCSNADCVVPIKSLSSDKILKDID